jgi:hypothetical protein
MRYFKIALLSLMLLGGIGALTGYFFFRRVVPVQSVIIPANAMFVLTADMRELMFNLKGHTALLAGSDGAAIDQSWKVLSRAIQNNKGAGIRQTADIQLFVFREKESAWVGIALALDDSTAFKGLLLDPVLQKEIPIRGLGDGTAQLDSSSAIIGWSKETALLLYPLSNDNQQTTREQVIRLLHLGKIPSMADNEEYQNHVLQEFDVGMWINPEECVSFTQSKVIAATLDGIRSIGLALDFAEDELILRRKLLLNNVAEITSQQFQLPTTPQSILGYWKLMVDPQQLPYHPLTELLFENDRQKELAENCTGSFTTFLHDTAGYSYTYTEMMPDENFNLTPRAMNKRTEEFGYTVVYELRDVDNTRSLLNAYAQNDSLQKMDSYWKVETGKLPAYIFVENKNLIVTTVSPKQFKFTQPPKSWATWYSYLDVSAIVSRWDFIDGGLPNWANAFQQMTTRFQTMSQSQPIAAERLISDEIHLQLKDEDVNAMVQLILSLQSR